VQYWNIFAIRATLFVLKEEENFIDSKESQRLNMLDISITLFVFQSDKSKLVRDEHSSNIELIEVTDWVSKLGIFK
jgi:hypothetical protein